MLLVIAAFFLLVSALEFGNILAGKSKTRAARQSPAKVATTLVPNENFEYVSGPDNDYWERRARTNDHVLRIQVSAFAIEAAKPYAGDLLSNLSECRSKFQDFKRTEAEKNPRLADEIQALEIDSIYFGSRKSPNIAEVWFTTESGGEPWTAIWDGKVFRDLRLEA